MLSRKLITFGLEMQTQLDSSCRFCPGRWHNQNLFSVHKMPKGCSLWPKVKLKICFAGAVKRIYDTSARTIRIRYVGQRKKGANGFKSARGDEAALFKYQKSRRRKLVCAVWQSMVQGMASYGRFNFNVWFLGAACAFTIYVQYIHFANTILTILCGKRCAAVTGCNCGRVATCHTTRFTAYVSVSALGGIGSGRAVHIRSAPG